MLGCKGLNDTKRHGNCIKHDWNCVMQQLPVEKYNLYGYQKIYLKWWKNNVISWNWGSILLQTYENQFVSKGVVHNLIFFLSKNIKHQSINVDNKTNKQNKTKQPSKTNHGLVMSINIRTPWAPLYTSTNSASKTVPSFSAWQFKTIASIKG